MSWVRAMLCVLVLTSCDELPAAFTCHDSSACARGALFGTCEQNGYCSFADGACTAGRRYDRSAGPVADDCVADPLPDGGTFTVALVAGAVGGHGNHDDVGANSRVWNPSGLAIEARSLYFSDETNNLVRMLDVTSGLVVTLAGSRVLGPGRVDGVGSAAQLSRPAGLVRLRGMTYFVEHMIGAGTGALRRIDGTGVVQTLAVGLDQPLGLTTDGVDLYVTLQVGGKVQRVAIDGTLGAVLATGLSMPAGLTWIASEDALYVVEATAEGVSRIALGGSPSVTSLSLTGESLNGAFGIAPAPGSGTPGALLVSERFAREVAILSPDSNAPTWRVARWAGAAPGGADGKKASAGLLGPLGITTAGTSVFLGDPTTLRQIDEGKTPQVQTLAGLPPDAEPVDGAGTAIRFAAPQGLARATDGTLYVAEGDSGAVRVLVPDGAGSYMSMGGVPAGALTGPQGLAVDDELLYVADKATNRGGGAVAVYVRAALYSPAVRITTCSGQPLLWPFAFAIEPGKGAYFSDRSANVVCWLPTGGTSATLVAGSYGVASEKDASTALAARFDGPSGLALLDGALFVTDADACTLRKIDLAAGGVVSTIAGKQYDRTSLTVPDQLTTDGTVLILGEQAGHRVRWFDRTGKDLLAVGKAGDGAVRVGTSGLLNEPAGLVSTADGVLLVSRAENVLLRISSP